MDFKSIGRRGEGFHLEIREALGPSGPTWPK
jgi:hypothetical protein